MVEEAWGRTLWDQGRRKLGNQGGRRVDLWVVDPLGGGTHKLTPTWENSFLPSRVYSYVLNPLKATYALLRVNPTDTQ